ncbi:hypothetical protein AB0G02_16495 [Actinosynnema sp. NPDC023658]|uniref:hypothetical protein n=1 Tax=Actinosynnema sp. NPDC023658 TaxID=3155465 RepID=UPI0033D3E14C
MTTLAARFGLHPRPGTGRALAAVVPVVLAAYLAVRGWLYPLWPENIGAIGHLFTPDPRFGGAWGGPTLAGAWLVHALVALGGQVVCLVVLRALYGRPDSRRDRQERPGR